MQSSRGLAARFDWLDYRELPGADHFDVIDPLSAAWTACSTPSAGETLDGMSSTRRIAVVGAGPAGTALALGLVRQGYDVTLVSDRTRRGDPATAR